MSSANVALADNRQHIDEKQLVGALLSAAPAHPNAVAGLAGVPAIRTLTPKSSSKSLKDTLGAVAGRRKTESTLIIPTISVTPAEGDEDDGTETRRDSFLAAQEAIAAARGVLGANAAALEADGSHEPLNGKSGHGKRGRRGRRAKPKPLVNFDEEKHGMHPLSSRGRSHLTKTGETGPEVDLDHPSIGFTRVQPRRRRSFRTPVRVPAQLRKLASVAYKPDHCRRRRRHCRRDRRRHHYRHQAVPLIVYCNNCPLCSVVLLVSWVVLPVSRFHAYCNMVSFKRHSAHGLGPAWVDRPLASAHATGIRLQNLMT